MDNRSVPQNCITHLILSNRKYSRAGNIREFCEFANIFCCENVVIYNTTNCPQNRTFFNSHKSVDRCQKWPAVDNVKLGIMTAHTTQSRAFTLFDPGKLGHLNVVQVQCALPNISVRLQMNIHTYIYCLNIQRFGKAMS